MEGVALAEAIDHSLHSMFSPISKNLHAFLHHLYIQFTIEAILFLKNTSPILFYYFSLPRRPEVFKSPRQILTLLNKVPGY